MDLFVKKPIEKLFKESDSKGGLKRSLTAANLIALGIGAIIGAGLFVRTAAASGEAAGPAVVVSYVIAAFACLLAGLCYAEFAAMIPVAGSAYAYAYVTMGEFVAWTIGWALVLEYSISAAAVAISWSQYLNSLMGGAIPYQWCHSPFEISSSGISGMMNIPAVFILLIITAIVIRGTKESATFNAVIVFIKVCIILVFIAVGWQFINQSNYIPYLIPQNQPGHEAFNRHGIGGVIGGAAIVFFAFIGFDAVSTAAQETNNPKRDMPIGILGSLFACTILFVAFSYVFTGVTNWQELKTVGREASVAYSIQTHMPGFEWMSALMSIAILAGFSSVMLVMLMAQSRIFYSMSLDGLLPKLFSELHTQFRTPYKSNILLLVFVGLFAAFVPGDLVGDLTSIGTLFAFLIVCAGVWLLRLKRPDIDRPFKTPWVPMVPILGVISCALLIVTLSPESQIVALIWICIGIVIYFLYSRRKSALRQDADVKPLNELKVVKGL